MYLPSAEALEALLRRVEEHLGSPLPLDDDARAALKAMADGDGRYLLNMAASLIGLPDDDKLDPAGLAAIAAGRAPAFDRAGDQHYNLTSAPPRRCAGPTRMPRSTAPECLPAVKTRTTYCAALRVASEDMAGCQALLALAAWQAYERLGSPEGELAVAIW